MKKSPNKPRLAYITRKFPPSTGGMETAAYELYDALRPLASVRLIAWGGSNKLLPIVYPWLFLRGLFNAWFGGIDAIYLQDGIMGFAGPWLRWLGRKPTVVTLHGLDITFPNAFYQALLRFALKHNDRLVAVSQATKDEVHKKMPALPVAVVNNGVVDNLYLAASRDSLVRRLAKATSLDKNQLQQSKILLTHGRLVKRKGVRWFVAEVMPGLAAGDVLYLISSDGPERPAIEAAIQKHGLETKVKTLGKVTDEVRQILYNLADLFIMPNIQVGGDVEGFGIVAVEASSTGTPVVAAALGGIKDAVIDGKNGFLAKPEDAGDYQRIIKRELAKPSLSQKAVRDFTLQNYSWPKAAAEYLAIMQQLAAKNG